MKKLKNKERCSVEVYVGVWHSKPCSKSAVIERDGKLYCKIHDPEYIKKKDEIARENYHKKDCKKKGCGFNFTVDYYNYCPYCGTEK